MQYPNLCRSPLILHFLQVDLGIQAEAENQAPAPVRPRRVLLAVDPVAWAVLADPEVGLVRATLDLLQGEVAMVVLGAEDEVATAVAEVAAMAVLAAPAAPAAPADTAALVADPVAAVYAPVTRGWTKSSRSLVLVRAECGVR